MEDKKWSEKQPAGEAKSGKQTWGGTKRNHARSGKPEAGEARSEKRKNCTTGPPYLSTLGSCIAVVVTEDYSAQVGTCYVYIFVVILRPTSVHPM